VSDLAGRHYALNVITPILSGREAELRTYLRALPRGAQSPLARLPQTHVARWVIVPHLHFQGEGQSPDTLLSQYLLFTSSFDGTPGAYARDLCTEMAAEADAVWGHCVGYPGTRDQAAFVRYLQHNRIPTGFFVSGYPEASVQDVLDSLDMRERFVAFAVAAQRAERTQVRERFREQFGSRAEAVVR
jgi:hypothetical protein